MEIARIPNGRLFDGIGGKDIHHVAWYDAGRHVHSKQIRDVVTDDGTVYRWARFDDVEPWTFQHRETPDGERDGTKYKLPDKLEELIDRDDVTLY